MPQIVKNCIHSIYENAGEYQVIFLDMNTYSDYVKFNPIIINKVLYGKINLTFFSDILRTKLIKEKGGIWLDATIFLSKTVQNELNKSFFSIRVENCEDYISKGKWAVYCIGSNQIGYPLFCILSKLLIEYWEKYDVAIDYYMMDYFINIIQENNNIIRKDMEKNSIYNTFWLQQNLNKRYNEMEWNVMKNNMFFKLSYKKHIEDNKDSYFEKVIAKDTL